MSNIIIKRKFEVKAPETYPLKDDGNGIELRWCEDHEMFYHECYCPKPDSSPEKDGWLIQQEGELLYAYPTEETYEALALWIDIDEEKKIIKCLRCNSDYKLRDDLTEIIQGDIVNTFFEIHELCREKNANKN